MDSAHDISEAGTGPKCRNGEGLALSPYEHILNYYERLQSAYGWTVAEIDESELDVLLGQMVVLAKKNLKPAFIEDVMG